MQTHWLVLMAMAATMLTVWLAYHKLSKAVQQSRHEARRHADNVISQVESLLSIHAELRPLHALPRSRGWAASPDFLALLISLAGDHRPRVVLECSSGYSTLVLAAVMRNLGKGHVYSLEHDEAFAAQTRRSLARHGLTEFATVVRAPLVPCGVDDWRGNWYDLSGLPSGLVVDMLVIDGPPKDTGSMARYPAVPCLQSMLSDGALIALDDADREDERQAISLWLRRNPKLRSIGVPTCEKGCAVIVNA